jgi:hypothetical protein
LLFVRRRCFKFKQRLRVVCLVGGKQWDGRTHPMTASTCQSGRVSNHSQRYRHSEAQAKKRIKAREQARRGPKQEAEPEPF